MSTQVLERPVSAGPSSGSAAAISALKTIARSPADADIGSGTSTQTGRERTVSLG